VAVRGCPSSAADIWALGCTFFRIRSGDDLFFDYDTYCPEDALRQIVKATGEFPPAWKQTKFDENGVAVAKGAPGEPFWSLKETRPWEDRVRGIVDELPSLFLSSQGEAVRAIDSSREEEAETVTFDVELSVPYPTSIASIAWRPTAVSVEGRYFAGLLDETDEMLKAFTSMSESEAVLLVDLLFKSFTYDPARRIKAEELVAHPWFMFHPAVDLKL
jgi:serine/threonine-protein kinase SRPK3